jgi:hypothetical protein
MGPELPAAGERRALRPGNVEIYCHRENDRAARRTNSSSRVGASAADLDPSDAHANTKSDALTDLQPDSDGDRFSVGYRLAERNTFRDRFAGRRPRSAAAC